MTERLPVSSPTPVNEDTSAEVSSQEQEAKLSGFNGLTQQVSLRYIKNGCISLWCMLPQTLGPIRYETSTRLTLLKYYLLISDHIMLI